jgi:adenosylcobyric acid synthase
MTAREYYAFRDEAWAHASAALDRLMERHDLVVIEGAGSPAEINLAEDEIVNMRVARHLGCPVILVGDIERGGVFASLYGTVALLGSDASLIKGFVINKFRGDLSILDPGLATLRQITGIGTLGVLPYRKTPGLDDEDGLALSGHKSASGMNKLDVVVVRLNYISNFTDFDALAFEPDVALTYSTSAAQVERADVLIVPGSKNTVKDLLALREAGLDQAIVKAAQNGAQVIGICGGYQMLGMKIHDPLGVESPHKRVDGIGLLDVETEYAGRKTTCRCSATTGLFGYGGTLSGYEIHMGVTTGDTGLFRVRRPGQPEDMADGSARGNVWGTYIHGVFDDDGFRRALLDGALMKKGLAPVERGVGYAEFKKKALDDWAAFLKEHLDMSAIMRMVE